MDVTQVLADLRKERRRIEEAILALERLEAGRESRPGRPRKAPAPDAQTRASAAEDKVN